MSAADLVFMRETPSLPRFRCCGLGGRDASLPPAHEHLHGVLGFARVAHERRHGREYHSIYSPDERGNARKCGSNENVSRRAWVGRSRQID